MPIAAISVSTIHGASRKPSAACRVIGDES
jgi:hypothetical protein